MHSRLIRRLAIEYSHFFALAPDVRRILLSYAFYLAAFPLVMTFMSAYLWRTSGNLWSIITYNLGYVIGLPPSFYLNGLLLKRFSAMRIYFLGTLLQGLIPLILVFIAPDSLVSIFFFGLAYGFGAGFYWGNKNYLSLILTRLTNRVYYNSIEQIVDLTLNIIVPAIAGWFITWGLTGAFGTSTTYQIVMVAGFILLFFSGLIVQSLHANRYQITGLFVKNSSSNWNKLRLFNILYNMQVGLNIIISSVIVLYLVGNEGILGTLHAVTASISALLLYIIGRKSSTHDSWKLVLFGSLIYLAGTLVLAISFNSFGGIAYSLVITVCWAFQWSSSYTVAMNLMDKTEPLEDKQYAYVCDNELFFNVGRILGITLVVLITYYFSQTVTLRFVPLIIALLQLPLAWFIYAITLKNHENIPMRNLS